MIYVKLKVKHVSENLSFTIKEKQKSDISKVIEFFEKQRMTQKAPSMQYKIFHLVLWRYCLRRFCPRGNDGPKKFIQVVTRVLAICRSFKLALMFSFTMLIECSSTQLKNLHGQKCTIIFFKLFYIIESLKFKVLDFNLRLRKNFTFKIVFPKTLTSIEL